MVFGQLGSGEESDYKPKPIKVAVVFLNSPADFNGWHLALRRLVKGVNMGTPYYTEGPDVGF